MDPFRLEGGMPNVYAYVYDVNSQFDPLGLECGFSENLDSKLKKHANYIYQTARKLGVDIPKGDKDAMK